MAMENMYMHSKSLKCLVIGGSGFLGRHLVEKLLERGHEVNVFDLRTTFDDDRINVFNGDLCNKEELMASMEGVDTVFHCATPSPLSNNKKIFFKVNVEGTKTVIEACLINGVKNLVLTSSASVVYSGRNLENGKEDLPYARRPMDYYTQTKIQQEKLVIEADGEYFNTVAIRPHGIFGPRDPHMLPTTARLAAAGKTKFIIGKGKNLVDFTYVENVVLGHIMAAENLGPNSQLKGKAYNITNDEPVLFWNFMAKMLTGLGYSAPKYHVNYYLIYFLAVVVHFFVLLLSPFMTIRPTLSPMTVALAGTHHFYSCEKAKQDFRYRPAVGLDEGIRKTLESCPELHLKQRPVGSKKVE